MQIITPDIRNYIFSQDWPKGLQIDLKEDDIQMWIVFYRDNWITLDPSDHEHIGHIVFEVITKLRNRGVPIFMERMESRYGT